MKNRVLTIVLLFVFLVTLTGNAQALSPNSANQPGLVYVSIGSLDDLSRFASTQLPLYTTLQGGVLTGANRAGQQAISNAGLHYLVLDSELHPGSYYLAQSRSSRPAPDYAAFGLVLLHTSNGVLLRMDPSQVDALALAGAELRLISLTSKPIPTSQNEPVNPAVVVPDPTIQWMIDQVTTTQVYTYDRQLAGELPVWVDDAWYTIPSRYTYSGTPIQKATHFVSQHMQNLGLDVQYDQWGGATYPNVIGEIPGLTNPDTIYIIGGHLDDVSGAPGADDNGSGSVATLLAADIFSEFQWGCTLRFAFWTGEEQGLLGSAAYAQQAFQRGDNILGYLNLDMIAWNTLGSDPGITLSYSTSIPPSQQLALLFADVVDAYNLNLIPNFTQNDWGSDHNSFWDYGYSSILGIEDWNDFNPYYHSGQDTPAHTDPAYFTNFIKASVGTFAHLTDCMVPTSLGGLDGHVAESGTGNPLEGATVEAEDAVGHHYSDATDSSGYYTMTLPADTYTVTASLAGYLTSTITTTVAAGEVTTLDFILEEEPCYPITQADFTWLPLNPVNGELVTFTGSSDGSQPITYTWDFGDGSGGSGNPATHTYDLMGDYTAIFTATNECGVASAQHVVSVAQACEPVIGTDFNWQPIQPFSGDPVTFTAIAFGTEPVEFSWNFGDGSTGTGDSVVHTYAEGGDYSVEATASNACGTDSVVKVINITQTCQPVSNLDFSWLPLEPFNGDLVNFTASYSGTLPIDFQWNFGDTFTGTGATVLHTYAQAGIFTATLSATNACGDDAASKDIVILQKILGFFLPLINR